MIKTKKINAKIQFNLVFGKNNDIMLLTYYVMVSKVSMTNKNKAIFRDIKNSER